MEALIKLAGEQEADWLEFKAAIRPPDGQAPDPGENLADYRWNVAKALIAMLNSCGGVVLLGVDDAGEPVGLEASDRKSSLRNGIDAFERNVVVPAIFPENGKWNAQRAGTWVTNTRLLSNKIVMQSAVYRDKSVLAFIVDPLPRGEELLPVEQAAQKREWLLIRRPGSIGQIEQLYRTRDLRSWKAHRAPNHPRFEARWKAFLHSVGDPAEESLEQAGSGPAGDSPLIPAGLEPTQELCDNIRDVLGGHPYGLTSWKISRMVPERPRIDQVSMALIRLQQLGHVNLIHGTRWRAAGQFEATQSAGSQGAIAAGGGGASRWKDFRQLCLYYAACARQEAGAHSEMPLHRAGCEFAELPNPIDWCALSQGESVVVSADGLPKTFLNGLPTSTGRTLHLGGPVSVRRYAGADGGGSGCIAAPAFVVPVEVSRDANAEFVTLKPLGPARINEKWLERYRRGESDRRMFREQCGLAQDRGDPGDSIKQPTLPELCRTLFLLNDGQWQEAACISRPDTEPPLAALTEPGIYNRAVLIPESSKPYTAKLQKELREIAVEASDDDLDGSALRVLFPHKPVSSATATDPEASEPSSGRLPELDALNGKQRSACQMAARDPIAVITGPPGTGKSRVVANVLVQSALEGRSALFASRNHRALEAVVPRLNTLMDTAPLVVRLNHPFGVEVPDPFREALQALFANPVGDACRQERTEVEADLQAVQANIAEVMQEIHRTCAPAEELRVAEHRLSRELERLGYPEAGSPANETVIRSCPPAPEAQKLVDLMRALEKIPAPGGWGPLRLLRMLKRMWMRRKTLPEAARILETCYRVFEDRDTPEEVSRYLAAGQATGSLVGELARWEPILRAVEIARDVRRLRDQWSSFQPLEELEQELHTLRSRQVSLTASVLKTKGRCVGGDLEGDERAELDVLWSSIQNHSGTKALPARLQVLMRRSLPQLMSHFPLWATTNLSAGRYLPLIPSAFDLLVVDEASQCDIPSVIPLLYRSRRVLVVGDPKQLRFVSSLSRDADYALRVSHGVDEPNPFERYAYRNRSFFDLASSSPFVLARSRQMLLEHYRCHTQIAGYFNAAFYNEQLNVNTEADRLTAPSDGQVGIRWTQVDADAAGASGGGAVSRAQIESIVMELQRLSEAQFSGTVGVVTPFRQQANRIRDRAMEHFGSRPPAHWDLQVDTADGFQGGERDVVIFSLVGGPAMPSGASWFYEHDANRFNVAISRARSVLHVFGDRNWALHWAGTEPGRAHIRRLVECGLEEPRMDPDLDAHRRLHDGPPVIGNPDLIGPVWAPRFGKALWDDELPVMQEYPACGRSLDFAMICTGFKLDVEVDGEEFHRDVTGNRRWQDIERDMILIGNGWCVKRFWVYELREDMAACVNEVRRIWESGR